MSRRTLYILYNADSTLLGKLKYGYRKLSKSDPEPACAACDITHGGLSLSESPKWLESKKEIEQHDVDIVQWHRDEIDEKLLQFIKSNNIRYPAVVLEDTADGLKTIMTNSDLNACGGDPKALVDILYQKNVLSSDKPGPSL